MARVRLSVAERREDLLRAAVGQIEARGVAAVRISDVAAVLGCADPVSAAWRLTAMLDGLAVQMTSCEGSLPRATMLEWADEALARELGLDSAAFGKSGPAT
ncbi:TetR family transcriptional regulator C-terminal domain-containing protein [Streptomyces sp. NPDC057539]|uniref:TetR family transcriptional regulator C-terminal domain-containing protein n=1 Tax=Streptomyces sp. NPDC057539 TaxID=3346159 RepID=UPI00367F5D5C